MRHDEPGPVDALVSVEEKVEVERPGAVLRRGPVSARLALDRKEEVQERVRREARPADGDRVQEVGLRRPADGLRPVERRDDEALDAPGEALEGP